MNQRWTSAIVVVVVGLGCSAASETADDAAAAPTQDVAGAASDATVPEDIGTAPTGDVPSPPPPDDDAGTPPEEDAGASAEDTGASAEDTGAPDTGGTPPEEDTGAPPPAVTYAQVWDEVLVPQGCTAGYCHGAQAGGMLLQSAEQSLGEIVGQDATQESCGLTVRVVPGEPEESVLWARVRPEADGCEPKMPMGSSGLSEADAKLVHDWIAGGAQP